MKISSPNPFDQAHHPPPPPPRKWGWRRVAFHLPWIIILGACIALGKAADVSLDTPQRHPRLVAIDACVDDNKGMMRGMGYTDREIRRHCNDIVPWHSPG